MAMTRVEKALTGVFPQVASWFQHSITPGQPAAPSTSTLTQPDLDRFNDWYASRMSGVSDNDLVNMTAELTAVIQSYLDYFATPTFQSWASTDIISRQMQWRLSQVDIADAVNTKGTVPPSFAADGVGTSAPGMGDITMPSGDPTQASGDAVSTGGQSPQLVFGDDGDIVTTGM